VAISKAKEDTIVEPIISVATPKLPSDAIGSGSQLESVKNLTIPTVFIAGADSLKRKMKMRATIATEKDANVALMLFDTESLVN